MPQRLLMLIQQALDYLRQYMQFTRMRNVTTTAL